MSRRSIITIIVGLFLFVATLVASFFISKGLAPSGTEIMASPQTQIEILQKAQTIRTTFQFVAILELLIMGVLAYQWRKPGIPHQAQPDDSEQSHKESNYTPVRFAIITGITAFVTSYVQSLLDVFMFDRYGGLNSNVLICLAIPAGFFGLLGGFFWGKANRKLSFSYIDLVPLIIIGIIAGIIPGACIKLLPQ